jgi:hypothetical protein
MPCHILAELALPKSRRARRADMYESHLTTAERHEIDASPLTAAAPRPIYTHLAPGSTRARNRARQTQRSCETRTPHLLTHPFRNNPLDYTQTVVVTCTRLRHHRRPHSRRTALVKRKFWPGKDQSPNLSAARRPMN